MSLQLRNNAMGGTKRENSEDTDTSGYSCVCEFRENKGVIINAQLTSNIIV